MTEKVILKMIFFLSYHITKKVILNPIRSSIYLATRYLQ